MLQGHLTINALKIVVYFGVSWLAGIIIRPAALPFSTLLVHIAAFVPGAAILRVSRSNRQKGVLPAAERQSQSQRLSRGEPRLSRGRRIEAQDWAGNVTAIRRAALP